MGDSEMTEPVIYDDEEDVFVASLEDPAVKYADITKKANIAKATPPSIPEEEGPPSFIGSKLCYFAICWSVIVIVVIVVASVSAAGGDSEDAAASLAPSMPDEIEMTPAPTIAVSPEPTTMPVTDVPEIPDVDTVPPTEDVVGTTDPPEVETEVPEVVTSAPTEAPTAGTGAPTAAPTAGTGAPTAAPTEALTEATGAPTEAPTEGTEAPTEVTLAPTAATDAPTAATDAPTTGAPTEAPTEAPTDAPTAEPTTEAPTAAPTTEAPTAEPTTAAPSMMPTVRTLEQILPEVSRAALQDPSSPQSFAYLFVYYDPVVDFRSDEELIQRFALASIYFALGRMWTNGFVLPAQDECLWFSSTGTYCNENDQVEGLLLSNNNLEGGPIPPEIGLLTSLREVDMSDNFITGTIPTYFGQLTLLESLSLAGNERMMGTVPEELGSIETLQTLDLTGLQFLNGAIPDEVCDVENFSFECVPDLLCGCDCACDIGGLF